MTERDEAKAVLGTRDEPSPHVKAQLTTLLSD